MCGRSSLTKTEKELEERFNATFYSDELVKYNPLPSYNVAPSHMMPIISNQDQEHFRAFRWGLIPSWANDPKIGFKMINARIETLFEKSSFKKAIKSQRCLVPSTGFYEWKKTTAGKEPYLIKPTDQETFAFAGIWDRWEDDEGQLTFSFSVITQPANKKLEDVHHRMPAILNKEQEKLWLDDSISPKDLVDMIKPYPDELIEFYRVSKKVNKVQNNEASLIIKQKGDDQPLTLF